MNITSQSTLHSPSLFNTLKSSFERPSVEESFEKLKMTKNWINTGDSKISDQDLKNDDLKNLPSKAEKDHSDKNDMPCVNPITLGRSSPCISPVDIIINQADSKSEAGKLKVDQVSVRQRRASESRLTPERAQALPPGWGGTGGRSSVKSVVSVKSVKSGKSGKSSKSAKSAKSGKSGRSGKSNNSGSSGPVNPFCPKDYSGVDECKEVNLAHSLKGQLVVKPSKQLKKQKEHANRYDKTRRLSIENSQITGQHDEADCKNKTRQKNSLLLPEITIDTPRQRPMAILLNLRENSVISKNGISEHNENSYLDEREDSIKTSLTVKAPTAETEIQNFEKYFSDSLRSFTDKMFGNHESEPIVFSNPHASPNTQSPNPQTCSTLLQSNPVNNIPPSLENCLSHQHRPISEISSNFQEPSEKQQLSCASQSAPSHPQTQYSSQFLTQLAKPTSLRIQEFNNTPPASRSKIVISVSGRQYRTTVEQLNMFPNTLLGNPGKRAMFWDEFKKEYFFNRHAEAFKGILYYSAFNFGKFQM